MKAIWNPRESREVAAYERCQCREGQPYNVQLTCQHEKHTIPDRPFIPGFSIRAGSRRNSPAILH